MNVVVLGGRVIGEALAHELGGAFVSAKHSQEERHLRRFAKIEAIEAKLRSGTFERTVRNIGFWNSAAIER